MAKRSGSAAQHCVDQLMEVAEPKMAGLSIRERQGRLEKLKKLVSKVIAGNERDTRGSSEESSSVRPAAMHARSNR